MSGFVSVLLVDEQRTRVFLQRHFYGHEQWMLPSYGIPLLHHDYLTDLLPSALRGTGITLTQEQMKAQGTPVAWLYPTQERQEADPSSKDQPLVLSLLTVDPQNCSPTTPEDGEWCFWPVHELPENILTEHALAIARVLFAEACHALPLDMRKARIVTREMIRFTIGTMNFAVEHEKTQYPGSKERRPNAHE